MRRLKRYSAAQIASMRHYLDNHVAEILAGNPTEELGLEIHNEHGKIKKTVTYRPALTLLMRELEGIHSLVVTDLSRLSRNHFLFGRISKSLLKHNVKTIGLMLSLNFMNSREIGDKL